MVSAPSKRAKNGAFMNTRSSTCRNSIGPTNPAARLAHGSSSSTSTASSSEEKSMRKELLPVSASNAVAKRIVASEIPLSDGSRPETSMVPSIRPDAGVGLLDIRSRSASSSDDGATTVSAVVVVVAGASVVVDAKAVVVVEVASVVVTSVVVVVGSSAKIPEGSDAQALTTRASAIATKKKFLFTCTPVGCSFHSHRHPTTAH